MKYINKLTLTRAALLFGAVAIILFFLPREDHQSYTYELNQPWKYQLLTADFDMPIKRDTASAHLMRDSIMGKFVPFVMRDDKVAELNETRFRTAVNGKVSGVEYSALATLLSRAYSRGIVEASVYEHINNEDNPRVRLTDGVSREEVLTIDGSEYLSPSRAFQYIDSLYSGMSVSKSRPLEGDIARALNICLNPNIILDTATNVKFLNQEYLTVNGALGMIKRGQRIVDRGEIVTPQVYVNLDTYMDMKARNHTADTSHTYFYIGQGLYILICFVMLYFFLGSYRQRFFNSLPKMTFLMSFITLFVVFAILMFEYFANGIYFVPFAAVPVVTMIFFDSRTAIFSLFITVMISALVAISPLQYIFLELVAGLVATVSMQQLTQRSQLLRTAAYTFVCYVICYVVIRLVTDGDLSFFSWRIVGIFAINAVILSFAYILILVIEKLFGFTSTVTLVELSDINSPLLRRLAEEAPGTFQHSMQVSTLAAEAARAIGANTQLVRTGALYHDIGKMDSPIFFTENQHGVNPHQGLNPETSAHKIISHVTGGLAMASKWKLPQVIRDFISEHHGKSVTRYFYNTAVNESPDGKVDPTPFTYPGPNPQTKETAILMMADSVEAASRSLTDYSAKSIDALVDKIIDTQVADGLFKDSPISFRDIETIKKTFKKRLSTIYHSRVAYPEIKK